MVGLQHTTIPEYACIPAFFEYPYMRLRVYSSEKGFMLAVHLLHIYHNMLKFTLLPCVGVRKSWTSMWNTLNNFPSGDMVLH